MSKDEDIKRYQAACHAMQSGVAQRLELDSSEGESKHLRVGINSAMSSHGALVSLLVKKRILTEEEYVNEMANFMEDEVRSYEAMLSRLMGANITLR